MRQPITFAGWKGVFALVLICSMVLAASVQPVFAEQPVYGGTLIIGSEGQHDPLDPHFLSGTVTLRITDLVYDTLVREDLSQEGVDFVPLAPGLAESWTVSPDGRTYIFAIRRGVTFHDGAALNAEAVKANFDRAMDPSVPHYSPRAAGNLGFLLDGVEAVRVADEYTLEVTLKEPFSSFPRQLADRRFAIISPEALSKFGDDVGANPSGTGPMRFVSKGRDNRITLERNSEYWGHKPYVDSMIFIPYTDQTTLATALQVGEVDAVMNLATDLVPLLQRARGVNVIVSDPPNQFFWMLNNRSGPTTDRRVRQAMNYAIDREAITENLLGGLARTAYGPVPRGNPVYDTDLEIFEYNPEKARELLDAAGVSTPLGLKVMIPTSGAGLTVAPRVSAMMQQDLRAVGIEVEFESLEWTAFLAKAQLGLADDTAALYTGWSTGVDDPYWLERMFAGYFVPPNGVNRAWYNNPAVDETLARARIEADPEVSLTLYKEAAAMIAEDAPWIFLYQSGWPRGLRTYVRGFINAPSPYADLTRLWLDN